MNKDTQKLVLMWPVKLSTGKKLPEEPGKDWSLIHDFEIKRSYKDYGAASEKLKDICFKGCPVYTEVDERGRSMRQSKKASSTSLSTQIKVVFDEENNTTGEFHF